MKEILIYSDAELNHEPTDLINQLTEPLLEMMPHLKMSQYIFCFLPFFSCLFYKIDDKIYLNVLIEYLSLFSQRNFLIVIVMILRITPGNNCSVLEALNFVNNMFVFYILQFDGYPEKCI